MVADSDSRASPRWNAEDYAQHSSAQLTWALELLAKLGLAGTESVLDIGCGDGKITGSLAAATSGAVLGIDASEEMIRLAAGRFPAAEHPNLSFRRMDAAAIRLEGPFDVAFSNAALHWVADHEAVLRGLRRCLGDGARILFQMGGTGNAAEMHLALDRVAGGSRWSRWFEGFESPYSFYGPADYTKWLPACGFEAVRVELVPKDMQHEGASGLAGWLRTTWFPYLDRVPPDQREAFLAEWLSVYLADHPIDSAGKTHVAMVRLEVEALAR